ncbi:Hsp33 family molecular chaperone HslO [Spiroplasma eriocheiris]|uniref:Heat shock protein 33 n=1 Tax=Spiroplasma eriocheiris TaxID=315358 RepID=A0A0H3XLH8_9MOLU|nr:Hsp33 family molecular chaperone HslO [Spiroplasma eriocheiris]AHF57163.1 putative chaperonin hsp33-like protein [Spiroplasma eriocheiris CCTCC M 207170]AKM53632.1 heat shock protein 33 [Spiroplasma eriocheiris]
MDKIIKVVSKNHHTKITVVDATESLNEIIRLQETNPLATIALSRVAIGTILIGSDMKGPDNKITTIINGNGPIGTIMAEYTDHHIRAFCANPQFDETKIKKEKNVISQVVGTDGYLQVIKDLGMKEPFTGQIDLVSGEINLDFTYYLVKSEQIKSVIACSVKLNDDGTINKAAGLFAQLLPDHEEEDIDYLEAKVENLGSITEKLIKENDLNNIYKLIDDEAKVLSEETFIFKCSCSREKALMSIKLLGEEQLHDIVEKNNDVEIVCDFCRTKYIIKPEEVAKMFLT